MVSRVRGVYMVGGVIRDEILGVPNKDVDFSVEADSYDNMREFILERGKIFLETPEFFTIRAHIYDMGGWHGDADFVLCRRESAYRDGRRPDIVEVGTIDDDLSRRDFTMNAIAKQIYPEIAYEGYYDPFGGMRDLHDGRIRCVGNARDRMWEDALRLMRAMRFSITKNMRMDSAIGELLRDDLYIERLRDNISMDRKKDELVKMFKYDTLESLRILNAYPKVAEAIFGDGELWLKATNEKR
jgi:tRNA nucleotidyltransferase (CCA-adding enzyme)